MTDNNAKQCLAICPLFEAEWLLELMLRNWHHPCAAEESFRQALLESATELLIVTSQEFCEEVFIQGLPAKEMNFVAAVWYAEWVCVQYNGRERDSRLK